MRENRPYGSEGGEQRYCSPTPIGLGALGAPLFAWIPAYAGTTRYLSLATFKAPGFSRRCHTHLRRSGVGGVQASARMARRFLPGSRPAPGRQGT